MIKHLLFITSVVSLISCSVLECSCEVHFEGKLLRFNYHGVQEHLLMGAEMFIMQENFLRENYKEIVQALVNSSSCNIVEMKDVSPDGDHVWSRARRVTSTNSVVTRAVIVEPRAHSALNAVIENICNKLHIPITLFHGNLNVELARSLEGSVECLSTLVNIEENNLNSASYNELLLSDERFWSKLDVPESDSVLIFQTDSGICGDGSALKDFEHYDYCGGLFLSYHTFHGGSLVGNGGFSIRNVATARRLLRENPDHRHDFYWEDVLFSHWCLKDPGCSVCSEQIGAQFSSTGAQQDVSTAWAFHRNWGKPESSTRMLCEFNDQIRILNS